MKNLNVIGVVFLVFVSGICSQSDDDGTAAAAAALTKNNTKVSQNLVPTDYICRACVCKGGKVDCVDQNIDKFFTKNDFAGLTDFKPITIDLSNNPLASVTRITELPVEVFNLSHCNIADIEPASFMELHNIRVLDLSYNKLTSKSLSPHAFQGNYKPSEYEPLDSMRILNLAYNSLHTIDQDQFEHLPELTELDLSGNPLTILDTPSIIAISSLPMLKVLKMSSCDLTELPAKFLHTPLYLEHLDLSQNQLTTVPEELEEAQNLVYLNLNNNPIVRMEKDDENYPGFPVLPKLEELHMCNMYKLTSIGNEALGGLWNLKKLHLSLNSKLSYIHPKALARIDDVGETYDWPPIRELYLNSNNLSEVSRNFVSRWDLLTAVDVTNNPYLCDCSTQWMVDVLVGLVDYIHTNASADMICQEPIEMRGKTMKHLHDIHRTMRCVDKYGNRPERDGAILLGTLIGVLLAVPIMLTLMLLWRRGYFSWCGVPGPAHYSRAFYKRAQTDEINNY